MEKQKPCMWKGKLGECQPIRHCGDINHKRGVAEFQIKKYKEKCENWSQQCQWKNGKKCVEKS
jgi:hypothetical protein